MKSKKDSGYTSRHKKLKDIKKIFEKQPSKNEIALEKLFEKIKKHCGE